MTKTELVERVAAKTGFTKKDSAKAVDAVFNTVTEALAAGEKVSLVVLAASKCVRGQPDPDVIREQELRSV